MVTAYRTKWFQYKGGYKRGTHIELGDGLKDLKPLTSEMKLTGNKSIMHLKKKKKKEITMTFWVFLSSCLF